MEHIGTGLSMSEYTLLKLIFEKVTKVQFKKFFEYETEVGLDVSKLETRGYIKIADGEIFLRTKALDLFKTKKDNPMTKALELTDTLRNLFPEGRKEGTVKYWRDSSANITKKLVGFFKKYGNFDKEVVIKATEKYIEVYKHDITLMRILPYFIEKDGESDLLTFIENMDKVEANNDLWTTTLK